MNQPMHLIIQPKGLFISGPLNLLYKSVESLGEFPEIHGFPIAYLGEFPEVFLKLGLVYLVIPVLSLDIITTQSSFARNLFQNNFFSSHFYSKTSISFVD